MSRGKFIFIEIIIVVIILGAVMIYFTFAHNNQTKNMFNYHNNHATWDQKNQKIGRITNISGNVVTINIYSRPNNQTTDTNNTTVNITLNDNIKIYTSQGRNQSDVETNKETLKVGSIIRVQYAADNITIQKIIVMIGPTPTN